jgi:hypothetical protein
LVLYLSRVVTRSGVNLGQSGTGGMPGYWVRYLLELTRSRWLSGVDFREIRNQWSGASLGTRGYLSMETSFRCFGYVRMLCGWRRVFASSELVVEEKR